MVEKTAPSGAGRKIIRAEEWTLLHRQYLAGDTAEEIAARAGITRRWARTKLWRMNALGETERRRRRAQMLLRQLVLAETALVDGDADTAARIARAIVALTAAGKSLEEFMKPDDAETRHTRGAEPAGRVSLEELRAEVERRYLGRHERRSMPDGDPGDGPGGAEPGAG